MEEKGKDKKGQMGKREQNWKKKGHSTLLL